MNILNIIDLNVEEGYKILSSKSTINWFLSLNEIDKAELQKNIGDSWREKIIDFEKTSYPNSELLKFEGYDPSLEFSTLDTKEYVDSKIIVLGTGYSNETANTLIAKFPSAHIYCLDSSRDVYDFCIQHYNTNKFTYLLNRAESIDYKNFDFIILTSGLINKEHILQQIYDTTVKGLIAIRNPKLTGEIIYEKVSDKFLHDKFRIVGNVNTTTLVDTVFVRPRNENVELRMKY